jgi:hypothetical protein
VTTALNCRIAFVNAGLQAEAGALGDLEGFLQSQFSAGSHGDIDLTFGPRGMVSVPAVRNSAVSALDLHRWLIEVNGNPPLGPVSTVCVLVASSYEGLPPAFGVMFDRGFTTPDDNNPAPEFLASPRQGCAIFLDSIAPHRPQGFTQEIWYTTAHELGHVFNLQHDPVCEADPNCRNLMRTSDLHTTYGPEAFHFTPTNQQWLGHCSQSANVRPGDSVFGSSAATNMPAASRYRRRNDLDLRLELPQADVWRFEPFQLEIILSSSQAAGKPRAVPELLDPASGAFRIFIENEARERRLYRPPLLTCGPPGKLRITPDALYRRDLPLFGEAGGYAFRHAGRYRIWAELDTGWRRLTSNVVELHVRSEFDLSADLAHARDVLTAPRIASLLFHREDRPGLSATRKLAKFVRQAPATPSASQLNFALGQSLVRAARRGESHPVGLPSPQAFFEAALQAGGLGPHAQARAEAHLVA